MKAWSNTDVSNKARHSLWVFSIVLLLPFLALTFFLVPQSDELCMAALAKAEGLVGGVIYQWETWSGRVAASFLLLLPGWLNANSSSDLLFLHKGAALLVLAAFVIVCRLTFVSLLAGIPRTLLWPLSFLGTAVLLGNVVELHAMLTWWPGAATFSLPGLAIVLCLPRLFESEPQDRSGPATFALTMLLVFASLSNVAAALFLVFLPLSLLVYGKFLLKRPLRFGRGFKWLAISIGLFGLVIALNAPGNEVRLAMQDRPLRGDTAMAVVGGLGKWAEYAPVQLFFPGWIAWSLLILLLRPSGATKTVAEALFPLLCWLFSVLGLLIAIHYGAGGGLPRRALNMLSVVGFFCVTASVLHLRLSDAQSAWLMQRRRGLCFAIALLLLIGPAGLWTGWSLAGPAGSYRDASMSRWTLLQSNPQGQPMNVSPLPVDARRSVLFQADLGPDPDAWPNSCYAQYFNSGALRTP